MERLSGLDASFLYIETTDQPLNICSILELDASTIPGGYSFERLSEALAVRLKAMPEFRTKLADSPLNLDHPVWVEDRDFDLSNHLHHIGLPSPGGRAELAKICGHLASLPLDRSKPVWEMWVIEDRHRADQPDGDEWLAVVIKVHHAAVDGVTGAGLLKELCSLEPEAPRPAAVAGPGDGGALEIVVDGLVRLASRPLRLLGVLPMTAASVVTTLRRARAGLAMAAPFTAPPTPFNAAVTHGRNVSFAQLDLADVKQVKSRFDVKVNDVVLALCAGVLRRFLREAGDLPVKPLVAMVPVSVHGQCDRPGRNQVSGMFCRLETHIDDAGQRLAAIARANVAAKGHTSALGPTLLLDWSQVAARAVFGLATGLMGSTALSANPVHNLIISNVAGPQTRLYFLGAEVKALYPLGPIFHGSGLNITVISLNGKLNIGIISCPRLVPDVWELADAFHHELAELLTCHAGTAAP